MPEALPSVIPSPESPALKSLMLAPRLNLSRYWLLNFSRDIRSAVLRP